MKNLHKLETYHSSIKITINTTKKVMSLIFMFMDYIFLNYPSFGIYFPFNVDIIRPYSQMIHYTMNHILFPRKINSSTIH